MSQETLVKTSACEECHAPAAREETHYDKRTFRADAAINVLNVRDEIRECEALMDGGYVDYGYGKHARMQAAKEIGEDFETLAVRLVTENQDVIRLHVFYRLRNGPHCSREAVAEEWKLKDSEASI